MDTDTIISQEEEGISSTQESLVNDDLITDDSNESDSVTFSDLGLDEYTLKAVEKKGFITPSPIQVLAIPRLLNGDSNLIARARTGTGKTAAFGLPIIQNIREKSDHVEALILEPTRELAVQTCNEMQSFSNKGIPRTTVLYGGASYATQIKDLKRGCEIVVGTPGRIMDHLERKTLDISKIKYFILDEGDEMLDMGFIEDIENIFKQANPDSRILLFSATMPAPILKIAADFMGEYDIIEEEKVIDEALLIDQKYWFVKESEKIEALVRLIDMSPDFYGLVFTMTKMDADNVTRMLDLRGYEAAALHGDIMQNQREKVLERFRMKKTRILVATDVAARGIDISGLSHVVNYSLPFDTATYVHRIGRTGRAGTTGIAVTFVRPEEKRKLSFFIRNVNRATKSELKEDKIPSVHDVLDIKEARLIRELREKLFEEGEVGTAVGVATEATAEITDTAADASATIETTIQTTEKLREIPAKYSDLAKKLCENQDATQVLAGVLSIMYGEKLSSKHYGKINTRDTASRGDQTRIFVSLGKKDGYRAKEIADYFSELLHIPGRMIDDIDVAQQFSLLSLPTASAKKVVEMSKSNHRLPHMHIDTKEEGRGSRKSGRKDERVSRRREEGSSKGRAKGNRPNVHTQVERSSSRKTGGASAFVKKNKKAERF
ncbi:MAG: DEAD/DEAH box helicase [Treponema sp.]|nr:DEAD/DEAH box helicase [Treponema sp.]